MQVSKAFAPEVAAVARRVAVSIALAQVAADSPARRGWERAGRVALADDLCSLSYAVDAAGVPDAALACAATDADRGTSLAARVAYAARLHLRGAWMETGRADHVAVAAEGERCCAGLAPAVAELRESKVTVALLARSLVRGLGQAPDHRDDLSLLRLISAAQASSVRQLIEALADEPFEINLADLTHALAGETGPPRDALAAAIPQMHGGAAKERAISALEVLDAVLEGAASSNDLARSIEAARSAVATLDPAWRNDGACALCGHVEAADRIFDLAAPATKAGERAQEVADALACADLDGMRAIAYAGSPEPQATIVFLSDAVSPVDIERFASALDCEPDAFVRLCKPGIRVVIASSREQALAEHFRSRGPARSERAWPAGEAQAPVVSPNMTFSASRLNSYVKCPRRFFYEYLCEALEDPGSLQATYGRVIHDALEALHREVRLPAKVEPSSILERLLRDLDAAFGAARAEFASQLEYESSRWRARRMAEQYVRWLVAQAQHSPMEIAAVEVFERRRLGDHDFIGYIDRIDRPEGGGPITIYDYKTGRINSDARAYLEKVRSGDEAQLALYYAMRRAAGDEIARIALVSIRDPKDEVWVLALDLVPDGQGPSPKPGREDGVVRVACSPADLQISLQALLRRCDLLTREGVEHFAPGEDPPCGFCEYARACRERPPEAERAFAR